MKKNRLCIFAMLLSLLCLLGCAGKGGTSVPQFSEDYFAGFEFGGMPFWYDTYYEHVFATVIISADKELLVYMPKCEQERDLELIGTIPLTDKQYSNIENGIDRKKLYMMEIKEDDRTEGSYTYIYLYDENNDLLKKCGGYEPLNKSFNNMHTIIYQNIPQDDLRQLMDDHIEVMKARDNFVE